MKHLIVLRGIPGIGKSTFVKEHGLENVTISTDHLRTIWSQPVYDIHGNIGISGSRDVNSKIFILLNQLCEFKMRRGEFIVIDATNLYRSDISKFDELCSKYDYKLTVVEFPHDVELAIERNNQREWKVSEQVIRRFSERFDFYDPRVEYDTIMSHEFASRMDEWLENIPTKGLSEYKRLLFIGDIHGSYNALLSTINNGFDPETFYVFLGDYFDRGLAASEVFRLLFEHRHDKNILLIEGNHENRLYNYLKHIESAPDSTKQSYRNFMKNEITPEMMIDFCSCLKPFFFGFFGGNMYYGTHAGISNSFSTKDLLLMPTSEFITGAGTYDDITTICDSFDKNAYAKAYNVFGHRNPSCQKINASERSYNLNGLTDAEVRSLLIECDGTTTGITYFEPQQGLQTLIDNMKSSDLIRRKEFIIDDNIIIGSYIFTNKAFFDKEWNKLTRHARGLYINENINKIICRGWEKFFNLEEMEETKLERLKLSLEFPLEVFKKENGFLGLVGYDPLSDKLIVTGKSVLDSKYSEMFMQILSDSIGSEGLKLLKNYVSVNDCTVLFEVIDPINDPHIIEYQNPCVVLIDIVTNEIEATCQPFDDVVRLAKSIGVAHKIKLGLIKNFKELSDFIERIKLNRYNHQLLCSEGFVFVDSKGYMFKYKTPFYLEWKQLRSIVGSMSHGTPIKQGRLDQLNETQLSFLEYVKSYEMNTIQNQSWNIIELRKRYIEHCNQLSMNSKSNS